MEATDYRPVIFYIEDETEQEGGQESSSFTYGATEANKLAVPVTEHSKSEADVMDMLQFFSEQPEEPEKRNIELMYVKNGYYMSFEDVIEVLESEEVSTVGAKKKSWFERLVINERKRLVTDTYLISGTRNPYLASETLYIFLFN
uniref:TFIIE beta domain-containing protein n=1 Tax=Caenorhabditis tropicalis TaxID=1561998 RepID=A0A1I7UPL6_9PELO